MSKLARDNRNAALGQIHKAKKLLCMTDDEYRQMLLTQANVNSAADLDAPGREKVLNYFKSLGFKTGHSNGNKVRKQLTAPERMVWALWYELEKVGRVNKPASSQARAVALRRFVKRQTGVDDLTFCNGDQIANLIEAMKSWVKRPEHIAKECNHE